MAAFEKKRPKKWQPCKCPKKVPCDQSHMLLTIWRHVAPTQILFDYFRQNLIFCFKGLPLPLAYDRAMAQDVLYYPCLCVGQLHLEKSAQIWNSNVDLTYHDIFFVYYVRTQKSRVHLTCRLQTTEVTLHTTQCSTCKQQAQCIPLHNVYFVQYNAPVCL